MSQVDIGLPPQDPGDPGDPPFVGLWDNLWWQKWDGSSLYHLIYLAKNVVFLPDDTPSADIETYCGRLYTGVLDAEVTEWVGDPFCSRCMDWAERI